MGQPGLAHLTDPNYLSVRNNSDLLGGPLPDIVQVDDEERPGALTGSLLKNRIN